jgi:hypothetical protein
MLDVILTEVEGSSKKVGRSFGFAQDDESITISNKEK